MTEYSNIDYNSTNTQIEVERKKIQVLEEQKKTYQSLGKLESVKDVENQMQEAQARIEQLTKGINPNIQTQTQNTNETVLTQTPQNTSKLSINTNKE